MSSPDQSPRNPFEPQLKPLFPDIASEELPEILRVDARTIEHLKLKINAALNDENPEALDLNSAQRNFVIEYMRFCVEHKRAEVKDWLAAAALYIISKRTDDTYKRIGAVLCANPHIAQLSKKLATRIAGPTKIIMDALPERGAVEAAFGMDNHLQSSQGALKVGNFDSAVQFAELAAAAKNVTPDAVAHAALCFFVRAGRKSKSVDYDKDERVADVNRALDLCRDFLGRTRGNASYAKMQGHMEGLMKKVSELRTKLMQ
jgi:hypothetical protein